MPIYPILIIFGLLLCYLLSIYKEELTQWCGSLHETGVNNNNTIRPPPTAPQAETQAEQERQQEERYFHILTNVVHKKAIAKMDDKEERIKLPHEEEISHRSLQSEYDEEAPPELKDTQELKTDITISTSSRRLRSWRRQLSAVSMTKISERMVGASDRESFVGSLYSPKTCPICLEKYEPGDDICWSKNENCAHAYHLECMAEWLMNNDYCPLCREKYLVEEDEQ